MSQAGYTAIQIYHSLTPAAVPAAGDLSAGELAINYADGIIYYKDDAGVVQSIASKNANAGVFSLLVSIAGTSASAGGVRLYEDTDNGTNYADLKAPASIASNLTHTLPSTTATLGYLNLPAVGTKTSSYVLTTADVGKYVQIGSGGSITIPDATFAEGDAVSLFNNTSGAITITCSITTAYISGTDSDKATMSLASRGIATVFFVSGTVCVVAGAVS